MLLTRIATAAVILVLLGFALFKLTAQSFFIAVAIVAIMTAIEWAHLFKFNKQQAFIYALVMGAGLFILHEFPLSLTISLAVLFWLAVSFVLSRCLAFEPKHHNASRSYFMNAQALINEYQVLIDKVSARYVMLGIGFVVLLPFALSAYAIRFELAPLLTRSGSYELLCIILLIAACDSGAYFSGRYFDGRKLAPVISPGKTIAGVIGGAVGTSLAAILLACIVDHFVWHWIAAVIIVSFFSVVGDLYESFLKRLSQVKDSGRVLPGHGGLFDRIDSATAVLPMYAAYLIFIEGYT